MRITYSFLFLFVLLSCTNSNNKVRKKRIGDKFIETVFINDSVYNGMTKFYSLSGVLEKKVNFENGIKEGFEVNYYSNGVVQDSVNFTNGHRNGNYFFFDSIGKVDYSEYFYFGKRVGKREFYNNGKIKEYDFISFDGRALYTSDYDSISRIIAYGGEVINLNASNLTIDGKLNYSLSLYIIDPPGVRVKYFLGLYNDSTRERRVIADIVTNKAPFWDTVLSKPIEGFAYFVQADYNDSSNNDHRTHIQPLALKY